MREPSTDESDVLEPENLEAWNEWLTAVLSILRPMAAASPEALTFASNQHSQGLHDLLVRCEVALDQHVRLNQILLKLPRGA